MRIPSAQLLSAHAQYIYTQQLEDNTSISFDEEPRLVGRECFYQPLLALPIIASVKPLLVPMSVLGRRNPSKKLQKYELRSASLHVLSVRMSCSTAVGLIIVPP